MQIYFYNYTGDNRIINKVVNQDNQTHAPEGYLRSDCDLIDPVIMLETDVRGSNYCYIPEFNRYYFISDIENIRDQMWQVTCHVDVLKTYEPWIDDCDIIVTRTSAKPLDLPGTNDVGFNAMLVDPNVPITQTTRNRQCIFGCDFGVYPSHPYFEWQTDNVDNLYLVTVG